MVSGLHVQILPAGERIDLEALRSAIDSVDSGAYVVFEGLVRPTEEGRQLRALDYEQHETMALPELERVLQSALALFAIQRAGCVHRTGLVLPGESSVAICIAAEHREPAFEACRYIMNQIKMTVPLWKRPVYLEKDRPSQ